MKKIFTLLFCLVAVSALASTTTNHEQCMRVLLGFEQPTAIMAAQLDANHDGEISIADVTTMLSQALVESLANNAPAVTEGKDKVQTLIDDILYGEPPTPSITEVTDAINEQSTNEQFK